jgi:hypothetical protein
LYEDDADRRRAALGESRNLKSFSAFRDPSAELESVYEGGMGPEMVWAAATNAT